MTKSEMDAFHDDGDPEGGDSPAFLIPGRIRRSCLSRTVRHLPALRLDHQKISADQRQTTRDEQCSTNALYASGNHQPSNIGRETAQSGGSGKERNTHSEKLVAPVHVPQAPPISRSAARNSAYDSTTR